MAVRFLKIQYKFNKEITLKLVHYSIEYDFPLPLIRPSFQSGSTARSVTLK